MLRGTRCMATNMQIRGIHLRPVVKAELDASHALIENLIHLADNKVKLNGDKRPTVKCTKFAVPDHASAQLRSWKMDEFSYGKANKPLPTNARGLFSYTDSTGRHEIVIRGYDKFFNTGQVPATEWSTIEKKTQGPYDVTLKQNGCIIFIGALPDHTLLVTSKHSIGGREDVSETHSMRGKKWLLKHLITAGKTERDLAVVLVANKMTIVCELCDDDFEEHILGYPPEKSGLYLHGINRNTSIFSTYPIAEVNSFAKEFGFLSNSHLVLPDLKAMRTLLDDCAKTGTYEGTEVEGFVVRTKFENQDFFFKYKFEEPYLLFRQWREVTKQLINGKEARYQKHQAITKDYLSFIAPIIKDPTVAQRYLHNHGIISLRQQFLDHHGGNLSDIVAKSIAEAGKDSTTKIDWSRDRFVIVPVATIGCGKTTMAVALQQLFGFGHVQNDNILGKRPALQFAKNIYDAFQSAQTRIVIADRNNHMLHERESLIRDLRGLQKLHDPPVHFIALSFAQTAALREFTSARVMKRGDNHQSIRAATMSAGEIKKIMDGFHHRFQPLDTSKSPDGDFCEIVEVDPLAGSEANLRKFVEVLRAKGLVTSMPTQAELEKAIHAGMNYAPTVYKHMTSHPSQNKVKPITKNMSTPTTQSTGPAKNQKVNYFALSVLNAAAVVRQLENAFRKHPQHAGFWHMLKAHKQVQAEFHVTMVHASDKSRKPSIWEHYCNAKLGNRQMIKLRDVVFDDRVMAITVRQEEIGMPFSNAILHITVGTANSSIKPFESNAMLQSASGTFDGSAVGQQQTRRPVTRIPIEGEIECQLRACR